MPVFYYDPPDRFVAGSVGQPGDRTFYLQATSAGRVTSVALEKFQVSLLAERLDELLDEVLRRTGAAEDIPESAPPLLRDDGPLDLPLTEDFRVGAIAWRGTATATGWSSRRRRTARRRSSRSRTTSRSTAPACSGCGSPRARPGRSRTALVYSSACPAWPDRYHRAGPDGLDARDRPRRPGPRAGADAGSADRPGGAGRDRDQPARPVQADRGRARRGRERPRRLG